MWDKLYLYSYILTSIANSYIFNYVYLKLLMHNTEL